MPPLSPFLKNTLLSTFEEVAMLLTVVDILQRLREGNVGDYGDHEVIAVCSRREQVGIER